MREAPGWKGSEREVKYEGQKHVVDDTPSIEQGRANEKGETAERNGRL